MASTNPLVIQGTASFPPDEGQTPVPVQFGYSGQYASVVDSKLNMVGSGTQVVPFGTIASPGAKAVLIEFELAQGAAPIQLKFNGSADSIELSPGGTFLLTSPAPATGITVLSIVHTADATVRVRIFG